MCGNELKEHRWSFCVHPSEKIVFRFLTFPFILFQNCSLKYHKSSYGLSPTSFRIRSIAFSGCQVIMILRAAVPFLLACVGASVHAQGPVEVHDMEVVADKIKGSEYYDWSGKFAIKLEDKGEFVCSWDTQFTDITIMVSLLFHHLSIARRLMSPLYVCLLYNAIAVSYAWKLWRLVIGMNGT